jgi:hypothetical protein
LIDQAQAGEDGIQLMTELLEASGQHGHCVTGFASREDGLRALRAGAYHYVQKTADWPALFEELILQMSLLVESRKTRRETEWLRVLTENVRQFQSCLNREDVAVAVIDGALRLGFHQARLAGLEPAHNEAETATARVGVSHAGSSPSQHTGGQPHKLMGELGPSPHPYIHPHSRAEAVGRVGCEVEIVVWPRACFLSMCAARSGAVSRQPAPTAAAAFHRIRAEWFGVSVAINDAQPADGA